MSHLMRYLVQVITVDSARELKRQYLAKPDHLTSTVTIRGYGAHSAAQLATSSTIMTVTTTPGRLAIAITLYEMVLPLPSYFHCTTAETW